MTIPLRRLPALWIAIAMAFALPIRPARAELQVVKTDREFYTHGSYIAFPVMWCANVYQTELIRGVDYADTITLLPSSFPDASTIGWRVPFQPPTKCGVYGYAALSFGNYDNGTPQVPVTPVRVRDLSQFSESVAFHTITATGEFNVLNELYLTSVAGNANSKVAEVGFLLHASASGLDYANSGTQHGTWTDSTGRKWQVSLQWGGASGKYVMFIPWDRKDVVSVQLDIRSAFSYLRHLGIITGTEWVNGIALGVEPIKGSGIISVDRFAVSSN